MQDFTFIISYLWSVGVQVKHDFGSGLQFIRYIKTLRNYHNVYCFSSKI